MKRYDEPKGDHQGMIRADGDGCWVWYDDAEAELSALRARLVAMESLASAMEAQIATLEAPPVVPDGWEVSRWVYGPDGWAPSDTDGKWRLSNGPSAATFGDRLTVAEEDTGTSVATLWHVPGVPLAALRALAWAIEHDARPPHASDGKEGGE